MPLPPFKLSQWIGCITATCSGTIRSWEGNYCLNAFIWKSVPVLKLRFPLPRFSQFWLHYALSLLLLQFIFYFNFFFLLPFCPAVNTGLVRSPSLLPSPVALCWAFIVSVANELSVSDGYDSVYDFVVPALVLMESVPLSALPPTACSASVWSDAFYSTSLYFASVCSASVCSSFACSASLCSVLLCSASVCCSSLCTATICYASVCYASLCSASFWSISNRRLLTRWRRWLLMRCSTERDADNC